MKSIWRGAVERFVLNHLEKMNDVEFAKWLDGDVRMASKMETTLSSLGDHRETILRELNAISPAELLDMYRKERPGRIIPDKDKALVRIGSELQAMKAYLMSL